MGAENYHLISRRFPHSVHFRIPKILAVDASETAVASLEDDLKRFYNCSAPNVELCVSDLFSKLNITKHRSDLIVFNPPWLPETIEKASEEQRRPLE